MSAGNSTFDGAISRDYASIAQGAGVIALRERMVVRIVGDDRVTFLHGMCSNDIKGLRPGAAAPALVLSEHAHVIADFFVHAAQDALIIEIDRALWPRTRTHLEKFLVADDVEFEEINDLAVIDVEGPLSNRAIAGIAGAPAAALVPWQTMVADGLRVANLPRFGSPAFTIFSDHRGISELISRICDENGPAKVSVVDQTALEILRIENGVARVGVDTTEKTIALEARLERAISFDKGCYIGQETIERATARGGIRKRLFGLRVEGTRIPPTGLPIALVGKEVGRLTSVSDSPRFGLIGLAILHNSAWQPATRVTINDPAGELTATVSDLPFR